VNKVSRLVNSDRIRNDVAYIIGLGVRFTPLCLVYSTLTLLSTMASAPLLSATIEPDDDSITRNQAGPTGNIGSTPTPTSREPREPVRLVPGTQQPSGLEEGGIVRDPVRVLLEDTDHLIGRYLETIISPHILGPAILVQVGCYSCLRPLRPM